MAILFASMLVLFAGCGGEEEEPAPNAASGRTPTSSGVFVDSPVTGLGYESGGISGTTDHSGKFRYVKSGDVSFTLGDMLLGQVPGAPLVAPHDLIPGAVDERHPWATNLCRLLQSLDKDRNPENGITITAQMRFWLNNRNIDYKQGVADFENDPEVLGLFQDLNLNNAFSDGGQYTLCNCEEAREHARIQYQLANPDCNVKFRREYKDFENAIGDPELDDLRLRCIQGPAGAGVEDYTVGQFTVRGDYVLGSQPDAVISVGWTGGEVIYTADGNSTQNVTAPGEGSFTVSVKTSQGGGYPVLYVRMAYQGQRVMDLYPKWDEVDGNPSPVKDCDVWCTYGCDSFDEWGLTCEEGAATRHVTDQWEEPIDGTSLVKEHERGLLIYMGSGNVYTYYTIYNQLGCNSYVKVNDEWVCYGTAQPQQ
ncbi:MAG: hypothetical protein ACLFOY_06870 [Desulfatibacillaceae bacterium]